MALTPVSTKPKVLFRVAKSIAAASQHPSVVKCHSSMYSFFSNRSKMCLTGLMLRKPGVGRLNQSGGSDSTGSSTAGMTATSGSSLSTCLLSRSCCRCLVHRAISLSCLVFHADLSGPLYPKLSTCFEGTRLTQLVQLVTAGRLFPCHKGRVNL